MAVSDLGHLASLVLIAARVLRGQEPEDPISSRGPAKCVNVPISVASVMAITILASGKFIRTSTAGRVPVLKLCTHCFGEVLYLLCSSSSTALHL